MNIKIRSWQQTDLPDLVKYANNVLVWNNLRNYFPHPYTIADGEWWLQKVADENPTINFAIDMDGLAIGGIGLIVNTDVYQKSAEIGYWLGEPFWRKGIATKAVDQITSYAFAHFDIVRMYAEVFETNKASMKVLEKNGYLLESVKKKAVYKNEVLMDAYVWVKLMIDLNDD